MEDLATDRIYRLMLAQRLRHRGAVAIPGDDGAPVLHDEALLGRCLDEALRDLVAELPLGRDIGTTETLTEARHASEAMILNGWHNPV
jgi:malate synthase